jgi:hypothetical protein
MYFRQTCHGILIVINLIISLFFKKQGIDDISGHEKQKGVSPVLSSLRQYIIFLRISKALSDAEMVVSLNTALVQLYQELNNTKSHTGLRKIMYYHNYYKTGLYTFLFLCFRYFSSSFALTTEVLVNIFYTYLVKNVSRLIN